MVTGTQFALRPTDNVKARVRDQDVLVEDRWNIDCSKAFIGGEDSFEENHSRIIIFHNRNYQLYRPPRVCHWFHHLLRRAPSMSRSLLGPMSVTFLLMMSVLPPRMKTVVPRLWM